MKLTLAMAAAMGLWLCASRGDDAAGKPASGPAGGELSLTQAANGTTQAAKAGQAVVISLKGNPTTGYSWKVKELKGPSLQQVGEVQYVSDANARKLVGAGGMFRAEFKAVKAGKSTVTLEYARPWEKNTPAAEVFSVTVEVAGESATATGAATAPAGGGR